MSLGYFVMPLHPRGSDPARTLEQRLDRPGSLDAWIGERFTAAGRISSVLSGPLHGVSARNDLRSFPLPGGEHREVTQDALETILTLWQI
jgi:hypothetical protein